MKRVQTNDNIFVYTFKIIKKFPKIFVLSFVISFIVYSFFYGLWKIPLINFGITRMSELAFTDYIFIFFASIVIALLVTLMNYERLQKLKTESKKFVSGSAAATGIVSAICPACQGIVFVALGSTILNIPLSPIIPYLNIIKFVSAGFLLLALFLKMDSIYKKTCVVCKVIPKKILTKKTEKNLSLFENNILLGGVIIIIIFLFVNTILISKAFTSIGGGNVNLGNFQYGSKITLKPMPLAAGEQPKILGYRSIVKSLPTISELQVIPSTGDAVQDLLNNVVPKGIPWYGQEAGVSFDDPVAAQNAWGKGIAIQLTHEEETRWGRIVNSFTCDYCCGSPQNPTIITRCGCAHSKAAQGMAKWFIKYYGSSYSDEEIYGEMARWYALWYPKGTIERIILEAQ